MGFEFCSSFWLGDEVDEFAAVGGNQVTSRSGQTGEHPRFCQFLDMVLIKQSLAVGSNDYLQTRCIIGGEDMPYETANLLKGSDDPIQVDLVYTKMFNHPKEQVAFRPISSRSSVS